MQITRNDLITGDGFKKIADELGLVYLPTHEVSSFLSRLRLQPQTFNLVTHRSDGCILPKGKIYHPRPMPRTEDFTWENVPSNVKVWFAQNCNVRDDRLIPIPIGVENDEWANPQRKKEVILSLWKALGGKTGLVYLNVNPVTNFERPGIYAQLVGKRWCTTEYGKNGVDFVNYARRIHSHKFVLCPEGNGMDTHRPWEALYLNSFPVVRRRVFTEEFAKLLPFVLVDDWEEVTEKFLEEKYTELMGRKWNWDALKMSYWEGLIKEKLGA